MSVDWPRESRRISQSPQVLTRALDDELVAYHPGTDDVTRLDPIARAVWERLDASPLFSELVAALADDFGAEPTVVGNDVANLLDGLLAAQLISIQ